MFVTINDIKAVIGDRRYQNISAEPPDATQSTIQWAMDSIADALDRFDTASVFAKRGSERNTIVVQWIVDLCLYRLYEKVADRQIPDRVIKNYDDTRFVITQIGSGKQATSLPLKPIIGNGNSDGSTTVSTQFRWGCERPRSH